MKSVQQGKQAAYTSEPVSPEILENFCLEQSGPTGLRHPSAEGLGE